MKIILYFLLTTTLLSGAELIPYTQYKSQCTFASYMVATAKN